LGWFNIAKLLPENALRGTAIFLPTPWKTGDESAHAALDQRGDRCLTSGEFCAKSDETKHFLGLKSKKRYEQGQMVYIGRPITADNVFAKLVDSGHKIESVEATLGALEAYLRMLQDYRIGNILRIEPSAQHDCGFRLVKIADHEPFEQKKLP
jgi:hypothetical protein